VRERHLSTNKHIDTSIVEDDRYKVLEEKYKALEEKHKALEDKFLKDQNIVDSQISIMEVLDDVSEDKVYNVSDMLSKTQYQTPSLEELKL
jgi:tRNA U34 5-carboxymethylaminomethyl modifying enzyme MnmG/GidA